MGQQEVRSQWKGSRWRFGLVPYFRILCWKSPLTHCSRHSNSQLHLHSKSCFVLLIWAKSIMTHSSLLWIIIPFAEKEASTNCGTEVVNLRTGLVRWYLNYRRTWVLTPSNSAAGVSVVGLDRHWCFQKHWAMLSHLSWLGSGRLIFFFHHFQHILYF